MRRRTIALAGAAAAALTLPAAAYGFLALSTRDAADPAALGDAPQASGGGPHNAEGRWAVADVPTNFVGYRIRERLGPVAAPSDAVARTNQVEGGFTVTDGRVVELEVTVDMGSLDSGSAGRDEFVRDEALQVDQFPVGELHLVEPVEIDAAGRRGEVVEVSVPGRLTLRGETRDVAFDVQARWNGPTIQAAGSTQIDRRDFGIDVSSRAGFNIDERGTVEFELTFTPAGAVAPDGTPPPTLVDNPATVSDEGEIRTPCQSAETDLVVDPPLLVTATTPRGGPSEVEVVSGAFQVTPVQTSGGLGGGVAWSPDGRRIVSSSSSSPEAPRTLATVDATGGTPAELAGLTDVVQPDWGPDGQLVYVQRTDGDNDSDVWIADADGSRSRPLVETPGMDSDPRWSRDGRRVVFTTVEGADNQEVVVVGRDGRGLRTLAGGPGYEYAPSFTPDGRRVLFVRDGSIFSIGVDGNDARRLTDGPSDVNPEMSPDRRQLAFLRRGSLHVARADGSSPTCVVTNQTITGGPRWRPTGR